MAVYTHIDEASLAEFLAGYDLGRLASFEGIAKGVSNTNYHVFTDRGRYILTLFEEHRTKRAELPFYLGFCEHLGKKGISCPQAYRDQKGEMVGTLCGKPAVLINFLEGTDIERGRTEAEHCAQMGEFTARLHMAAQDFPKQRINSWAMKHWRGLADGLRPKLEGYHPGLEKIIYDELDFIMKNWPMDLPAVAIHGDLFPDNVFFQDGKITAVIDFYFSCTEFVLFDLAIVVNAWCFDEMHQFRPERYAALMREYEKIRPLTGEERKVMRTVLRGTAMRFLLSRLQELFNYTPDMLMVPHNPQEYLTKLKFHQEKDIGDSKKA